MNKLIKPISKLLRYIECTIKNKIELYRAAITIDTEIISVPVFLKCGECPSKFFHFVGRLEPDVYQMQCFVCGGEMVRYRILDNFHSGDFFPEAHIEIRDIRLWQDIGIKVKFLIKKVPLKEIVIEYK